MQYQVSILEQQQHAFWILWGKTSVPSQPSKLPPQLIRPSSPQTIQFDRCDDDDGARDGDGAPREERKRSIRRDAHADTDAAVADTATFRAENIGGAKSPRYASHFFPLRIWSWCQILLRKNVGRRKVRGPQQNTNVDPNGGTSPCRVKCCVHNKFALQRDHHHHHRAGCLP